MQFRSSARRDRPAPNAGHLGVRRTLALLAMTLVALVAPQAAHAATTTFTVDALTNDNVPANTADDNPGNGVCHTAVNTCTLYAAIQEADAMSASAGDDILIDFALALGAPGVQTAAVDLTMQATGASPNAFTNDYLGNAFHFKIAANRPVTIDFDNRVPVTTEDDGSVGQFLIASDNVTLKNFPNISAGDGSIVVGKDVQHTTINNGTCSDVSDIAETCIGIISGASDVKITDVTSNQMYRFGIFVDRAQGVAAVSNVTVTRFLSQGTLQYGDIWFELDSKVDGFTVSDSDFKANSANGDYGAFGLQAGSDVRNLTVDNSRFDGSGNTGLNWYGFFNFAGGTTTNLKVTNSAFTKTFWVWTDYGSGPHDGLTFQGNTFTNVRQHVLDFVNSAYTNLLVDSNAFTDELVPGNTDVWVGQAGTNNVISNNTFSQSVPAENNRWAIYNDASMPAVTGSTGWSFVGNFVGSYQGIASGPIINNGTGKTRMEKNTFGPNTRGTLVPLESEAQQLWFVVNNGGLSNNRIQTYRPTKAVTDGTNVTLTVAPVTPPLGVNNAPTDPVTVDVFWTADDNAEEYIGRIPNVSGATTATLPTTHADGKFRVQTLDADGYSSQYSGPADVTAPPAPVIIKVDAAGNLKGTGEPGATVTVYDQTGKVIGTAKVQPDGTWSVPGPVPCGTTLTAKQTDDVGNVSSVSEPFKTADCPTTPKPAIAYFDAAGNVRGTGEPDATVTVYDQTGKVVGTAKVQPDGTWVLNAPLACGSTLTAKQTDAAGNVSAVSRPLTTPACTAALTGRPQSVNDIILRCGRLPLALVDVQRAAKRSGKRGKTTIVGVADNQYAGQEVAIRFLATGKVVGHATVDSAGSFSLKVDDPDPSNRIAENQRRYRAELGAKRSRALKLTRRFDVTSITESGSSWQVKARVTRPFKSNTTVRVRVLNACDGTSWKLVKTTRLGSGGAVSVKIDGPAAGTFQVVRLETSVPRTARKGARLSKTYTVLRGV